MLLPYCTQPVFCMIFHLYYFTQTLDLLIHWFIRVLSYRIISWWFILFYIAVIVDSSGCAYLVDGGMRYIVYRWGFSCLDFSSRYQSHESIYWARTIGFVTSVYPIIWCLIPVRVYAHDTVSNSSFWIRFIDTRMLVPARQLTFTTCWRVSDSPGSSCLVLRAWSLWIFPIADQRCAVDSWIIGRPSGAHPPRLLCSSLEFFSCNSWAHLCTFHHWYLFVFSHLCLSVM